jgi:hypothetical protein
VLDEFMLAEHRALAIRSPSLTQRALTQSHPYCITLSIAFAGQNAGIKEASDQVWLVSSMQAIWASSIRKPGWVTSAETRFAQKCYLCAPYESLSMR